MSPETARYFNDQARKLREDPNALNREFREQMGRAMGFEPDPRPQPEQPA